MTDESSAYSVGMEEEPPPGQPAPLSNYFGQSIEHLTGGDIFTFLVNVDAAPEIDMENHVDQARINMITRIHSLVGDPSVTGKQSDLLSGIFKKYHVFKRFADEQLKGTIPKTIMQSVTPFDFMLDDGITMKAQLIAEAKTAECKYMQTILELNIHGLRATIIHLIDTLSIECLESISSLAQLQYKSDSEEGTLRIKELADWSSLTAIFIFQQRLRAYNLASQFTGNAVRNDPTATPVKKSGPVFIGAAGASQSQQTPAPATTTAPNRTPKNAQGPSTDRAGGTTRPAQTQNQRGRQEPSDGAREKTGADSHASQRPARPINRSQTSPTTQGRNPPAPHSQSPQRSSSGRRDPPLPRNSTSTPTAASSAKRGRAAPPSEGSSTSHRSNSGYNQQHRQRRL